MIAFSGIDGAGKSTQIKLLKNKLEKNGKKVTLFWGRGGYTPGMELIKRVLRNNNSSAIPLKRGHSDERDRAFSKKWVKKMWLSLSILDLIFFYGIYVRIKEFFGSKVVCDRHIIDTKIDFLLNFPDEKFQSSFLWKMLIYFAKVPEKHFLLIIPVEESLRRSKEKQEPFPDSYDILKKRLKFYNEFNTLNPDVLKLDCMMGINTLKNIIFKDLTN